MSVAEILLPTQTIEAGPRDHMSGLFHRSNQLEISSNALSKSDGVDSDSATRKRVEFQSWTTNIADVHLSTPGSERISSLKLLPPSRSCQQTRRPILKANTSTESLSTINVQNQKRSASGDMDSLLEQLAHNDRLSSLDAYQTMISLIRTYEHPPEEVKIQERMPLLQKYLKRDLLILDVDADSLPSESRLSMQNLVVSAVKLLVTIVWVSSYATCLSDEFRIWTVERALQVVGEETSKVVVLHYLHFLAMQNYPDNILTGGKRAARLLEILHNLSDRFSGKSVLAERLLIYQKLLDQAKHIMKSKADLWIGHLLTGLSHGFRDVRSNAISVGTRSCSVFKEVDSIAVEARKQLAHQKGERTLSNSITNRLENMLVAKDEGNQIPQIWTIVVLLCNNNSQKLETWTDFQDWVRLIQRCFNCSDSSIKTQSYMAWNRLYYLARPHQAPESILSLLAKPTVLQLGRMGSTPSKGTRQAVISSFAMLLYYSFRPGVKPQQYTRMWNEYIVKIMTTKFLSQSVSNCDLSCRVLSSLFHSSMTVHRVWNEHRALENAPLDPLELPVIDCKWIRSQMSAILSIVDLLVQYSSFGPDGEVSEQAYVSQTWANLMKAVRESSSKEIVTSPDTKTALSCITKFLRLRTTSTSEPDSTALNLRLALLSKITAAEFGNPHALAILDSLDGHGNMMIIKEIFENIISLQGNFDAVQPINLKIIEQCLEKCCDEVEANTSVSTLNVAANILSGLSLNRTYQALVNVQERLALIIENTMDTAGGVPLSMDDIYKAVVKILAGVPLSSYHAFDDLIAAILTVPKLQLRTAFLELWRDQATKNEEYKYGPKVLDICKTLVGQTTFNLPGVAEVVNEEVISATTSITEQAIDTGDETQLATPPPVEKISKSAGNDRTRCGSLPDHTETDNLHCSSSDAALNFKSQLLTSKRDDSATKQNAEMTITFADVPLEPAITKRRANMPPGKTNQRKRITELDKTPSPPQNKFHEESGDEPTPTPKTRKIDQPTAQLDVSSSPPSVICENEIIPERNAITSSPIKDLQEARDTIQLGQIILPNITRQERQEQALVPKPDNSKVTRRKDQVREDASADLELPDCTAINVSSTHNDIAVQHESSTPSSEIDEYDVLAATQLSQNLEEQSFVVLRDGRSTPLSQTKRKHLDEPFVESHKKKRKSSENVPPQETPPEDSVIPSVELSTTTVYYKPVPRSPGEDPSSIGKRRKSSRRRISHHAVHDGSSPAESTVVRHKHRLQPDHKSRPRHRIRKTISPRPPSYSPIEEVEQISVDVLSPPNKTKPEEEEVDSELSSLASEILETLQPQDLVASPELIEVEAVLVANTAAMIEIPAGEPGLQKEDEGITASSIIQNLQEILDSVHGRPPGIGQPSEQELITIHRLCFNIGLKVQEWSSSGM